MLRVTVIEASGNAVKLRVEGRIASSWIAELRQACEIHAARDGTRLFLELGDISFVDDAGVALLRELLNRGVTFIHITPFVAERLRSQP